MPPKKTPAKKPAGKAAAKTTPKSGGAGGAQGKPEKKQVEEGEHLLTNNSSVKGGGGLAFTPLMCYRNPSK